MAPAPTASTSKILRLILISSLTLVSACGGRALTKIEGGDAVLPKELEDQFAVRSAEALVPSAGAVGIVGGAASAEAMPATQIEALKAAKGKKKKKGKGKKGTPEAEALEAAVSDSGELKYPNRRPLVDPIYQGEELTYDITYFGVSAGEVVLKQQPPKVINNRRVYHFKADIQSSKVFALFYKLNDTVESYWDYEGLFSHRYHLVLDEKAQTRDALELYDSVKGQTFYWNRWNHETKGYIETKEFKPMTRFPQDAMSLLYYVRTLPLEEGKVFSIPTVAEGKVWEVRTTVLRKERKSMPLGKRDCFVLKPEIFMEGKPQNKGEVYLWVTDDENRYPVQLEAKVRIGTIHMSLSHVVPGTKPDGTTPVSMNAAAPTPVPDISETPTPLPSLRK